MKTSKPRDPRYSRVRFVHILLIFLVQLRWFFSISNECRVLKSSNKNNFLQLYYIMTLLQNFANFTKKHLPQVHFLVKIHGYACNLFQRKTPQQVFSLQILRTFTKPLFLQGTSAQLLLSYSWNSSFVSNAVKWTLFPYFYCYISTGIRRSI